MIKKWVAENQSRRLSDLEKSNTRVAVYLKSGIKLVGRLGCHDQFTILLNGETSQLIYKHAIATIVALVDKD
jgi:host factor-I protein